MWIAAGMLAVSSVLTVVSASRQASAQRSMGQAKRDQLNYQAAVARNNAIISRRRAADIRLTAAHDAAQVELAGRQLRGRQRAILAANGVLVGQDSALEADVDVAGLAKQDALTVTTNAEKLALMEDYNKENFLTQEQALKQGAEFAFEMANFSGDSTMLGGATTVAGQWGSFAQKANWGSPDPKVVDISSISSSGLGHM
jgi:hypothetical protein